MCLVSEPCDVWNETHRRARKEHQCTACDMAIRRFESYIEIRSLFEGDWETYRVHLNCYHVGQELMKQCEMWNPAVLAEDLREHGYDDKRSFTSGTLVPAPRDLEGL